MNIVLGMGLPKKKRMKSERFRGELGKVLGRLGYAIRMYAVRDVNEWVVDRVKEDVIGGFRVPGEKEKERRVLEFSGESGSWVDNRNFKPIHMCRDGNEAKKIINLVLLKKTGARYFRSWFSTGEGIDKWEGVG